MDSETSPQVRTIGRAEEASLRLVFGGPVSLWLPLARLVGVKVDRDPVVDDALLAEAEAGAVLAARRFGPALAVTAVAMAAMIPWYRVQSALLLPLTYGGFHKVAGGVLDGGMPFWVAMTVATATMVLGGLIVGLLDALVFGAAPLFLLRRCMLAAAPAVSLAMAQGDDAFEVTQAERYPRLAYAAERILYPRGRARG